jgi:hypothetical protein
LRVFSSRRQKTSTRPSAAQSAEQIFNNRHVGGLDTYLQVVTAQTTALLERPTSTSCAVRRASVAIQERSAAGTSPTSRKL